MNPITMKAHRSIESAAEDLREVFSMAGMPALVRVRYPNIEITSKKPALINRICEMTRFRLCPSGIPVSSHPRVIDRKTILVVIDPLELERLAALDGV